MAEGADRTAVLGALDQLDPMGTEDAERIAVIGRSFAGYYSCRALAFEHRPKALVVFGAFYSVPETTVPSDPRHWLWMAGASTIEEAQAKYRQFTLEGLVGRISCPMLIVHGEDDHLVPVGQAHRVFAEATCPKELVIYKSGQMGSVHCAYDSFPETMPKMFDWLADQLGHKQEASSG